MQGLEFSVCHVASQTFAQSDRYVLQCISFMMEGRHRALSSMRKRNLTNLGREVPAFAGMRHHFIYREGRTGLPAAAQFFPPIPTMHVVIPANAGTSFTIPQYTLSSRKPGPPQQFPKSPFHPAKIVNCQEWVIATKYQLRNARL